MHIPVLQNEVLEYLDPRPNENFIDCTIGEAGHSFAILERNSPKGKVLGIDWSPKLIKKLELKVTSYNLQKRLILVCDNFTNLEEIVKKYNFGSVYGILFDLGMSSWHLEKSGRGFSFMKNEPLDMRYNFKNQLTAAKIVNWWSSQEIGKILNEYGEERFAKRIANQIAKERRVRSIETTFELVRIIKKATPSFYHHKRIHFATKTFQALRITVNDELDNLKKGLVGALAILKPGGRLIVISFHSLEDRIVKIFFRDKTKEELLHILTKKPVSPSLRELKVNHRARSAKLRAAIKI